MKNIIGTVFLGTALSILAPSAGCNNSSDTIEGLKTKNAQLAVENASLRDEISSCRGEIKGILHIAGTERPEKRAKKDADRVTASERAIEIADLEGGAGGTPPLEIASASPKVRKNVEREKLTKIQVILKFGSKYPPLADRVKEIQNLLKSEEPDINELDKKFGELEVLTEAYRTIDYAKQIAKLRGSPVDKSVRQLEEALKKEDPNLDELKKLTGLIRE